MTDPSAGSRPVPRETVTTLHPQPIATLFLQRVQGDSSVVPAAQREVRDVPYSFRSVLPAAASTEASATGETEINHGTAAHGGFDMYVSPCPRTGSEATNTLWLFQRSSSQASDGASTERYLQRVPVCASPMPRLPAAHTPTARDPDPFHHVNVASLRTRLHALGYGCGATGTDASLDFCEAILAFQWDHSLPVTGRYDRATHDRLAEVSPGDRAFPDSSYARAEREARDAERSHRSGR